MLLQGQVGPQVVSDGTETALRLGKSSEKIVTELHGKYYETNYRSNLYIATMTAGVIFPAPGATANNPMSLYNPAGSGKNVVLISFEMILTDTLLGTIATGLYGLYVNTNVIAAAVTGTAITAISGLVGTNNIPVAKPLSTSTVPVAPTLFKIFGQKVAGQVVTQDPITGNPVYHVDFDGAAILSPGTAITPQMTAADSPNATVICSFIWEETLI